MVKWFEGPTVEAVQRSRELACDDSERLICLRSASVSPTQRIGTRVAARIAATFLRVSRSVSPKT